MSVDQIIFPYRRIGEFMVVAVTLKNISVAVPEGISVFRYVFGGGEPGLLAVAAFPCAVLQGPPGTDGLNKKSLHIRKTLFFKRGGFADRAIRTESNGHRWKFRRDRA